MEEALDRSHRRERESALEEADDQDESHLELYLDDAASDTSTLLTQKSAMEDAPPPTSTSSSSPKPTSYSYAYATRPRSRRNVLALSTIGLLVLIAFIPFFAGSSSFLFASSGSSAKEKRTTAHGALRGQESLTTNLNEAKAIDASTAAGQPLYDVNDDDQMDARLVSGSEEVEDEDTDDETRLGTQFTAQAEEDEEEAAEAQLGSDAIDEEIMQNLNDSD